MSFHNKDRYPDHNTVRIRAELILHGMSPDQPSQMSDTFRFGYMAAKNDKPVEDLLTDLEQHLELELSNHDACVSMIEEMKR